MGERTAIMASGAEQKRKIGRSGLWAMAGAGLAALAVAVTGYTSGVPQTLAAPADLPSPPAGGELGFVVNHFAPTYFHGEDDCPDGPAQMLRANWLATMAAPERARIQRPENAQEFRQRYRAYAMGPDNTDICTHYARFDRAPQRTVQGHIAPGFDLDGDASGAQTANTCAHGTFTSPDGQATGIDNQLWRAMGCLDKMRGIKGMPPSNYQQFDGTLANGQNAQVILLRGVDSLVDDPDVEVIYTNTSDRAVLDSMGHFLPGGSFVMVDERRVRNVLHGRIANGVFEARSPLIQLRYSQLVGGTLRGTELRGTRAIWRFEQARLRLEFQADGTIKGMVGGYQTVHDVMQPVAMGGLGAAVTADFDCPVLYATVRQMADGGRDPKTGQCTSLSMAMELTAMPAFVTYVPDAAVTMRVDDSQ